MGGSDWRFSWGPQDDAQSIRTIHRAMDLGINWIDTAPVYGLGHCEEVVGKALRGLRSRPFVATKCARCWDEKRQLFGCLKRENVLREVDDSLRRLGIDVIDLYQIHWPAPDEDLEEGWSTIAQLIAQGKVRFGGVSNFNLSQLKRAQAIHPVTSLQPPYSMLVRGAEAELLPYCAAQGIGVIGYSPMQKGLLTGKVTREWVAGLPADDHRRGDPNFTEPRLSANLELVESLRAIAARHGKTVSQLAIAWVLRRSEMTAAIVGARRPDQIEQTVAGGSWTLPAEDLNAIEALLRKNAP
jgi:aryl-alcohol dehydrogenase-like predicted oxidoreductase